MSGEIFGTSPDDGQQWIVAFYSPGEGEVCMGLGLTEIDPAGGSNYENIPVYTAQVSSATSDLGAELFGGYYYYNPDTDAFRESGEYTYNLDDREVRVRDAVTGAVLILQELAAELTNDDLVALLQPCHGFEADASPAPRGEE